jgi:hypothetical protein
MQRTCFSGSPDSQLPLAATDRCEGVDGLDTGLHRLFHALPLHDRGRLQLECAPLVGLDLAKAVDRVPERVHDTPEVGVAHRHRQDLAGAPHGLALVDSGEVTEHDDADLPGVEVERDAERAVFELQQLVGHGRWETFHAGDAVSGLRHRADLFASRGLRLVVRDELLQRLPDLVRTDRELRHDVPCSPGSCGATTQRRRSCRVDVLPFMR